MTTDNNIYPLIFGGRDNEETECICPLNREKCYGLYCAKFISAEEYCNRCCLIDKCEDCWLGSIHKARFADGENMACYHGFCTL